MTNPYKGICSPCGLYLGSPTTFTSTWTLGQCENCGRMEPVTELRDFGYPFTAKDAYEFFKDRKDTCNQIFEANNLNIIQTIIRKIKTGRVTL